MDVREHPENPNGGWLTPSTLRKATHQQHRFRVLLLWLWSSAWLVDSSSSPSVLAYLLHLTFQCVERTLSSKLVSTACVCESIRNLNCILPLCSCCCSGSSHELIILAVVSWIFLLCIFCVSVGCLWWTSSSVGLSIALFGFVCVVCVHQVGRCVLHKVVSLLPFCYPVHTLCNSFPRRGTAVNRFSRSSSFVSCIFGSLYPVHCVFVGLCACLHNVWTDNLTSTSVRGEGDPEYFTSVHFLASGNWTSSLSAQCVSA